jgi:alkylation response protein AidB-like acyl-CoA dehydrogenase
MDLSFSAEDEAYRERLRSWLAEHAAWQRTLYEAGYVGLAWPREYGGQGASFTEQVICAEELARARTPPLINTIGLSILGPTLVQHGSEAQKAHFLPRILRAEDLWCQGFSEPEAGSDLASLRCRAEQDGDDFVVTGQKVWTSLAPIADWMFLLVRSDPDAGKRDGISYLLCDMKTQGITVRPLRNAAGGMHFSETAAGRSRAALSTTSAAACRA